MTLTGLAMALVLAGSAVQNRVLQENFDSLPRGGAPRGWRPISLDKGPLGIWMAVRDREPGSWPQVLVQDGRPYPPRWTGLALPGAYTAFSARVLVGRGRPGSGAAGLALVNPEGRVLVFAAQAGGRGLTKWERTKDGKWSQAPRDAGGPVKGPWLIFLKSEEGLLKASWGTVDKVRLRMEAQNFEGPWTLALASRTEGSWFFDDLKVTGQKAR